MSQDKRYRDIIQIRSGVLIRLASSKRNYKICKILFDPKIGDSYIMTQLVRTCLQSQEEYDQHDPTNCNNFVFFQRLLRQTKLVDGAAVLKHCMNSRRTEYFEYLLEVNKQLDIKFTVEDIWKQIGSLVNSKLLRSMINTNIKGLEYSSLNNDELYFKALLDVCSRGYGGNYSKSDPKNCRQYKCIQLLLEQAQVQKVLGEAGSDRAIVAVTQLINGGADACIELFVEQCNKYKLDIDWTLCQTTSANGENLLQIAVSQGQYQSVEKLLNLKVFDINYKNVKQTVAGKPDDHTDVVLTTAILSCISTFSNYDANNVENCENWKIFCRLLQEPGIDLNITDNYNRNIIAYCQMYNKPKFLNKLKELVNNQQQQQEDTKDDKDKSMKMEIEWKMDEASIEETVTKYKIGAAVKNAVANGDDKALSKILQLPEARKIKNDLVNMVIESTSILVTCVASTNVGKEERTKCFEILLESAKRIEFENMPSLWHHVCRHGTPRMLELLLNNSTKKQWKKYLNMKDWRKESCLLIAVTHDNIEMLKKLISVAEKHNSAENIVIDVFSTNRSSQTAIEKAISQKKREMIKLLAGGRWDNYAVIDVVIKYCLQIENTDTNESEDLLFFKSLFNTTNSLSGIDWRSLFQKCVFYSKIFIFIACIQ